MLSDTTAVVVVVVLVAIATVLIPLIVRGLSRSRPDVDSSEREQAMAQIRAYTGRPAEEGEPAWDGQSRGTAPTDEF